MQRVIQRTATARKQALRRAVKDHERKELLDRIQIKRARKDWSTTVTSQLKAARKNRWEDWEKGPLAPMRDSGLESTTYGSLDATILHPPRLPKHEQRRHVLFAEGDRVCVIRGRDRGSTNIITQVNRDSETVLIKDVNMADVLIPEWAKDRIGQDVDTQPQAFPVSFNDIRHVIPLEDTETGELKHVIVQHAYAAAPYHERPPHSKLPRYTRYVSGLNVEIPWPVEEDPVISDGEMDTSRVDVEASTFVASLGEPPMPSTVIDELRNKYSRFRTRHDPEYLREKMLEDYQKEYRETASLFMPRTDALRLRAARAVERNKANSDANGRLQVTSLTAEFLEQQAQRVKDHRALEGRMVLARRKVLAERKPSWRRGLAFQKKFAQKKSVQKESVQKESVQKKSVQKKPVQKKRSDKNMASTGKAKAQSTTSSRE